VPKNRKPFRRFPLSPDIADLLAAGPTRLIDAIRVEEVYEGRPRIFVRWSEQFGGGATDTLRHSNEGRRRRID
jgi:hypothetical protein